MLTCVLMGLWLSPADLLAVVGGVFHTEQVRVGPSIQVRVFSTDVSVPCVARPAFTAEHGLREETQVDAVGVLVTVVAAVLARVTRSANLEGEAGLVWKVNHWHG